LCIPRIVCIRQKPVWRLYPFISSYYNGGPEAGIWGIVGWMMVNLRCRIEQQIRDSYIKNLRGWTSFQAWNLELPSVWIVIKSVGDGELSLARCLMRSFWPIVEKNSGTTKTS
jgi:hypothetical protein